MTQQIATVDPVSTSTCTPAARLTKSLLGYGVIAGPLYVTVGITQALSRDGFDPTRHAWSLLANGQHGWIQIATFVVAGSMVLAFSGGLRRALTGGRAATWAPRLVAVYGASLVAAGVFRADPALGFPAGAPEGPVAPSWHGALHLLSGAVGFGCLAAACFVIARRYAVEGRRGWARVSRLVGAAFLTGFGMVATGGGSPAANVVFTAAVVVVWAWLSAVAVDHYRSVAGASSRR
jgi:hypothetical protein